MTTRALPWLKMLLLTGFLISNLLPFAMGHAALSLQSPDNGNILICTAQGFEWISVDEFDQDDLPAAGHSHDCPLCFVAAQAVNTPGLAPFALPATVTRTQPATRHTAKAHQFYRLAYASRAPPV